MPALLLAVALLAVEPPANPVLAAARKRQEVVRSIEVLCSVTEVKEPFSDHGGKTPEVRTVSHWTERIVFDGNRSRTEVRRFYSSPTEWHTVETCEGTLVRLRSGPLDRSDTQFLSGKIMPVGDPTRVLPLMGHTYHLPLIFAVRGVILPVEWSTRSPHLLYLTPQENELTDQRKPWSVYLSAGPNMRELRLWIDPKQDHAIQLIRWQSAPDTPFAYQMEVKHARHEPSGLWLPKWWEHVDYDEDDKPRQTQTFTVEKVTVNANWPDSEFDLAFPPGCRVHDAREDGVYFVEKDGTLRPFRSGIDDAPPTPPLIKGLGVVVDWCERHIILLASLALTSFAIVFGNRVLKKLFRPKK